MRKVKVWAERTFRGETFPEPVIIESASYKTDYILIPKDEEAQFCKQKVVREERILPRTIEFPPVMKDCLIKEMVKKGEPVEKLELPLVFKKSILSRYRVANEGEKPNIEITLGLGETVSPSLYEGIRL